MRPSIKTFKFNKSGFNDIKEYHLGTNWPVVYLIENNKEMYIGETTNVHSRSRQHYESEERRKLNRIHVVIDGEFNKSAILDIESLLIQYMIADGKYTLQNSSSGLVDHNYFDKEKYREKFEVIWEELKKMALVDKSDLNIIKNSNIFKFSPYKALTDDQVHVSNQIIEHINLGIQRPYIINGGPGTGKTILAVYLFKKLKELDQTKNLKIGLVVPMSSLRKTLKNVFRQIPGLKSNMILGPSEVIDGNFDILIVDEAHRLRRRRNITNFASFDQINLNLGLGNTGTELDWIMRSSKYQIFMYDKDQSVRPSDVRYTKFENINAIPFYLKSQKRIMGGDEYIKFVDDAFGSKYSECYQIKNYDLRIYENIAEMVSDVKKKNDEFGLCRLVAGYAWSWKTKDGDESFDIEIDGLRLIWNSINIDWVNSPNAINEVGCIHTVQGYDLNYTGLIIGPELSYDFDNNKFVIDKEKYMDINGRRSLEDSDELEKYILNIYKTLMTRGIKGTYIYVVDEKLRKYFKEKFVAVELI